MLLLLLLVVVVVVVFIAAAVVVAVVVVVVAFFMFLLEKGECPNLTVVKVESSQEPMLELMRNHHALIREVISNSI